MYDNVTSGLPVLAGDERAAAEIALAAYDTMPRGSSPDQVRKLVGSLSWMPRQEGGADAAKMQLAVYKTALADIDSDVLASAFREAVQTLTFFPSIAELRAIAARHPTPARYREAWRLRRMLAAKPPPKPALMAEPAEVAAILDEYGLRADDERRTTRPLGPPRTPSYEDWLGLGFSPDEARQAVDQVRSGMDSENGGAVCARPPTDRKREIGWRIIARALAGRYSARRQRESLTGYGNTLAEMIGKHGQPPFAWLVGETRMALAMRRDMAA